jgi:hypothetical protein
VVAVVIYGQAIANTRPDHAWGDNIALIWQDICRDLGRGGKFSAAAHRFEANISQPFRPIPPVSAVAAAEDSRALTGMPLDCPNSALREPPSRWSV